MGKPINPYWHEAARRMRLKGMTCTDIARGLRRSLAEIHGICTGIVPVGPEWRPEAARLQKEFGIKVMRVERDFMAVSSGQIYRETISMPFVSILAADT
jgi:hypothetical protein